MRTRLLSLLAILLVACSSPRLDSTAPPAPLRVLILGDSISMGYTPHVREILADRAVVVRPTRTRRDGSEAPENCAGTNNGVQHLERWLAAGDGTWDVIHFNFGLHDLKRVDPETGKNSNEVGDPHQAPPERYQDQLRTIALRLKATGAKLVFANTTPVPSGELRPHREPEDALVYNRIAERVMDELSIPVLDLHGLVTAKGTGLQRPADVHFTPDGSRWLAEHVAAAIVAAAAD